MLTFTLKSKDLSGQLTIDQYPQGFGFNGGNLFPQLYWENAPADTQSFSLTRYDLDAPTGIGFWH